MQLDWRAEYEDVVRPEWIDSNDHMNLAYYVVVFDHATDRLFDALDVSHAYRRRTGHSNFVAETHTIYEREVMKGDLLRVRARLLQTDSKRLHLFHEMFQIEQGYRAAVQELMCLNVDMATRRVAPFPEEKQMQLRELLRARGDAALPPEAGRRIALPEPRGAVS